MSLGVTNELVGNLLDCIKSVAAEGDSGSFDFLVLDSLFLSVLVSHLLVYIHKYYMINLIK